MKWNRRFVAGAVCALAIGFVSLIVARGMGPGVRLVVLYAPCTVNRGFLAPYGGDAARTPQLAAFARDGVVFTKHVTESAQSGVAYASLLSGTQAMRHGVYRHPTRLDDDVYLITEAYRDAGWDVYFWADQDMASPELNYAQGVDAAKVFWDPDRARARKEQNGAFLRADQPAFREVLAHLRDDSGYKALLVTTFTVTHTPYSDRHLLAYCREHAGECAGLDDKDLRIWAGTFLRYNRRWQETFDEAVAGFRLSPEQVEKLIRVADLLYASNVAYLDGLFGDVVRAIDEHGLGGEALISFTADHGERMYSPGAPTHWTHGFELSPDTIVVPWILRGPGVRAGRFDAVTRSVDVFPTLAGLSGVPLRHGPIMGIDLSATVRGRASPPRSIAFSHTALLPAVAPARLFPSLARRFPHNAPSEMWVAAWSDDLVYELTSPDGTTFRPHVYDWRDGADPHEDLYEAGDGTQRTMVDALHAYKRELIEGYERAPADQTPGLPSASQRRQLRALGYVQ